MNVMIFSASIGHGHNQVAQALASEAKCQGHAVQVIDGLEFVSPFLSKVLLESYLNMLRYTPSVYGKLYQWTEEPMLFDFASLINKLLCRKFKRLLALHRPEAILCTHSFPAGLLAALKLRLGEPVRLVGAVTDFTVHYTWVNPGIDTYVLASHKLMPLIRHMGVQEAALAPLGIPIRPRFANPPSKIEARLALGLNDKPTVLVMGGGLGMGTPSELVRQLDSSMSDSQMIVLAGTNESLLRELKAVRFVNPVTVLGFVENVEAYMAAADVLVTKPGGVTCAEALAMALPLVFVSPIPGQEWRNSTFLVEQLAAIHFEESTLAPKLADLIHDEVRLSCMSRMARELARPHAAREIVELLQRSK
ncbi:MAG: Processive diacylglycerol beta-glucosyltransferase [Firmicutes bacterium]|nr:Processive diacylglycerol beta-glucosyltransferase [candidate division NPL-UPA2 bacterium]